MAKVQVQVVVDRKQVDQLSSDLDKLNGKKIKVETEEFRRGMSEAARATGQAADNLKKFVEVQDGTGKIVQEVREYNDGLRTTVRVTDKLNEKTGELERFQKKTTTTYKDAAKAQKEQGQATKEANKEVKQQGLLYDILGRSVSSFLARMVAYRAVYAGIRAVTNGFKEALETLKAVDTELVTVRKVTGFDQWQMAGVEEQAYAVASKYGTSAADYTSSVAAFARAGYKELSGNLAELAEKTKIVGDTTADVAQQFLLSVDAAYKYKGNIEALTAVLDGANAIDNAFATSIEKIAEGMGIVAPVAAQMNVGVDELAASIGTITAVTQRTGTEAARALRAIYLNIVGDTKTEIEEGVTWTTGEIEGLRDVIKLYAKDAYDAAQASGGIIDPMEAIAGLAQSVKDGVLTEAKLMEMVSDIGGKLRTSQLLAIVNNWDMYEQMLETYRNSAGSAEKEIENAMDSWERKTEVLKNTWTQFVKTTLNSNVFKGFLDALTWIVQRLGTLRDVLHRVGLLVVGLKLKDIINDLYKAKDAVVAFAKGLKETESAASTLNWVSAAITALAIAWSAVSLAIEDAKIKHQEMVQKTYEEAAAAKESSDEILTLYAGFNSAKEGSDDLTESVKKLAEALGVDVPESVDKAIASLNELSIEQLRDNLADIYEAVEKAKPEYKESAVNAFKSSIITSLGYDSNFSSESSIAEMWASLRGDERFYGWKYAGTDLTNGEKHYNALIGNGNVLNLSVDDLIAYRKELEKIVEETQRIAYATSNTDLLNENFYLAAKQFIGETAEEFQKLDELTSNLDTEKTRLRFLELSSTIRVDSVEAYAKLIDTINLKNRGSDKERQALIALAEIYYPQFSEAVEGSKEELEKETAAVEEAISAEDRLTAAKERATKAVRDLIPVLFDENGKLTEQAEAALKSSSYLADLVQAEIDLQNQTNKANYAYMRAQLTALATDAVKAAKAIMAAYAVSDALVSLKRYAIENGATPDVMRALTLLSALDELDRKIKATEVSASYVAPYTSGYSSGSSSSGSSGGSHSSSSTSTEDKKLKSLQERVTLLKSELSLMKERGDSEADQIAKMREIQNALKAEWEYLQSIKGDQATINGLMQDWWSIENSVTSMMDEQAKSAQAEADALQKALEAQLALNNALKNRSVRYYNASTNQWEWGANQQNVQSAYSAYQSALAGAPSEYQGALIRQGVAMTGYGIRGSFSDFMSRLRGGGAGGAFPRKGSDADPCGRMRGGLRAL